MTIELELPLSNNAHTGLYLGLSLWILISLIRRGVKCIIFCFFLGLQISTNAKLISNGRMSFWTVSPQASSSS